MHIVDNVIRFSSLVSRLVKIYNNEYSIDWSCMYIIYVGEHSFITSTNLVLFNEPSLLSEINIYAWRLHWTLDTQETHL